MQRSESELSPIQYVEDVINHFPPEKKDEATAILKKYFDDVTHCKAIVDHPDFDVKAFESLLREKTSLSSHYIMLFTHHYELKILLNTYSEKPYQEKQADLDNLYGIQEQLTNGLYDPILGQKNYIHLTSQHFDAHLAKLSQLFLQEKKDSLSSDHDGTLMFIECLNAIISLSLETINNPLLKENVVSKMQHVEPTVDDARPTMRPHRKPIRKEEEPYSNDYHDKGDPSSHPSKRERQKRKVKKDAFFQPAPIQTPALAPNPFPMPNQDEIQAFHKQDLARKAQEEAIQAAQSHGYKLENLSEQEQFELALRLSALETPDQNSPPPSPSSLRRS